LKEMYKRGEDEEKDVSRLQYELKEGREEHNIKNIRYTGI